MSEIVKKFIADRFGEKEGISVNPGNIGDVREFAQELGSFLYRLHRLPTTDAKSPSFENAFAGSDLIFFEAEMIELLKVYQKVVPADLLQEKFDFAAMDQAVIPRGDGHYPDGEFDNSCIYASSPVTDGQKVWIYYMGGNGQHTNFRESSLGRAYWEVDKFACWTGRKNQLRTAGRGY